MSKVIYEKSKEHIKISLEDHLKIGEQKGYISCDGQKITFLVLKLMTP